MSEAAAPRGFRLAVIQMRVEGGAKRANLARAGEWIARAAAAGAEVALLPEAMNLGWTHPSAAREAEQIPGGESFEALARLAGEHSVHVCAGLVESEGGKVFNTAVLIGPRGELIARHRKINELTIGQEYYSLGSGLGVAETQHGKIGLMICSDAFAPGQILSRSLAHMGADVILSPCAWAVTADHDSAREPYGQLWRGSYQPVAREYSVWIAAASNVGALTAGPWAGRNCIGCSLVVDARGEVVAEGRYGVDAEEMILVDVRPTARPAAGNAWRGEHE